MEFKAWESIVSFYWWSMFWNIYCNSYYCLYMVCICAFVVY